MKYFKLKSQRLEPLVAALGDKDSGVRWQAAEALGQLGDQRAVEPLVAALGDKEKWVHQHAAIALGRIGDSRAVEPLVAALGDNEGKNLLRQDVAEALGQLGDQRAVEPLVAALGDKEKWVRQHAAIALGQLGWKPVDETQRVSLAIAQRDWDQTVSLGLAAVEPLVAALGDKDSGVREQAAEALGRIGDSRAVEPLVAALGDKESLWSGLVRRYAAEALGRIGDNRAVGPLVATLEDKEDRDWVRRRNAAEALGRIGDNRAVEPLIATLEDKEDNVRVRYAAAEALGCIGDSRAVEPLVAALEDKEEWVRRHAAISLGCIGDSRAVEPLVATLEDKEEVIWVRHDAAEALGQIGDSRAVEPLVVALEDKENYVHHAAAGALGQLGWQPVDETQRALLAIAQQDWDQVVSLGPAAVEPLIELLRGGYRGIVLDVREEATRALEAIGDPRGMDAIRNYPLPKPVALGVPPPALAVPPPFVRGKRRGLTVALSVIFLLISAALTLVVGITPAEHVPPTAGFWNLLLFIDQLVLLTIVVCLIPTFVSALLSGSRYAARVFMESAAYIVIFLGFALWLLGTGALGSWLFYAAALVLLIEAGSHYLKWYKDNTLKRLRNGTSYKNIEVDAKALEKMTRNEVALYIPVPVGLVLGTVVGLIRHQTALQVVELCIQVVLLLAALVLLYFLIVGFLQMSDPPLETVPKFLPPLTKSVSKGKRAPKASQRLQEALDQQYIDLACDISRLRMVYKYDALHNTILLVAFILILIEVWLIPIDVKWLIASLLFATLVFSEIPYGIGQYRLHNRILEQYTGGKHAEMAKKLQDYAPIFPPWAFLGALLTTGTAGGILYVLLNQIVQNALQH
jgi:HEAT repeat protein